MNLRSLILAPLLLATASPVAADDAIEHIVVTATRRAVDSSDVSASVSTAGADSVAAAKLATDALRDVAGVHIQQTTPGQGAAIIRGLKGSAVLHLVDGMRLSNAMFRTAPTPWFALVPTTSVERLEVIRGTPASLYGSEAVGGVVQSVSRLPDFESSQVEYAGDVIATFDSAELQKSIRATLDFGTRQLSSSLSAEYLETGDRRVGARATTGRGHQTDGGEHRIHHRSRDDRPHHACQSTTSAPDVSSRFGGGIRICRQTAKPTTAMAPARRKTQRKP